MNMRLFNFNPLVQNGQKLIPSVTRVFRKDQEMYVFLEAYEPAATQDAAGGGQPGLLSRQGEGVRIRAA